MAKVLLVLIVGGSFVFSFALAVEMPEGCEDPGPRPEEKTVGSWQVESVSYQCGNNQCGGTVKQKTVEAEEKTRTFYTPEEDEIHCPIWKANVVTRSTSATRTSIDDVPLGKYQACPESANSAWFSRNPGQCSGSCYPAPVVKPLNDEFLSPKNVFDSRGKPKLPLNMGWEDNVALQFSRPESKNPDGSACEVEKYKYTIGSITSETTEMQVVPGGNQCALEQDTAYEFLVRACAGNTCGISSKKLPVATSDATQLLSPYDPDWEGGGPAAAPLPVTLQWCPRSEANSYRITLNKVNPDTQEDEEARVFGVSKITAQYIDSLEQGGFNLFTPFVLYRWNVRPCSDFGAKDCEAPDQQSQTWKVLPGGELAVPRLSAPADNAAVNMKDSLVWNFVPFASRYVIELSGDVKGGKHVFVPTNFRLPLNDIWDKLVLDSPYSWKVASCGGSPQEISLSGCGGFSESRTFDTTGAAPKEFSVSPLQNNRTAVPVTFNWDNVPGAASYRFRLGGEQSFNVFLVKDSQLELGYPALVPNASKPDEPFQWSVRTCADEQGLVCGNWSSPQSFRIAPLKAPDIIHPEASQTEFLSTTQFAWTKDFGSNFFTYELNFLSPSSEEKSPSCQAPHPVAQGLPQKNSASIRLRCLGQYEFNISACVDKACEAAGPQKTQRFSVEKFVGKAGGLIPCDANNDNPATIGLDEREPCELKHLFLLLRNLVDFALWKLSLVILIAMTAFTGFTMYTSFGGMEVASRARSTWKAVGAGFLILFFSWLLLNLLLGIVGFQVNIFGHLYELPS